MEKGCVYAEVRERSDFLNGKCGIGYSRFFCAVWRRRRVSDIRNPVSATTHLAQSERSAHEQIDSLCSLASLVKRHCAKDRLECESVKGSHFPQVQMQ